MKKLTVVTVGGESKRFKSETNKALSKILSVEMVCFALNQAKATGGEIIVSCDENVKAFLESEENIRFIGKTNTQAEVLETPEIKGFDGEIIIIPADMPCLLPETVSAFSDMKLDGVDALCLGDVIKLNADAIGKLDIKSKEDISDLVKSDLTYEEIFAKEEELINCDTRQDLAKAIAVIKVREAERVMNDGVTLIDPDSIYISPFAEIGADTVIYPDVFVEGNTKIGKNCVIRSNTVIENAVIGDNTTITSSVINSSTVGTKVSVGPFAYIRPDCKIGDNVKVGDFVELKKAKIGNGTKISHLTYVGDSEVGERVNFGCGTVTVNYDGKNKFLTKIGDDAFIGCNTNLVAPVTVGNGAFTAAGSTITDNVPDENLAIARAKQVNKTGWVKPKNR